MLTEENLDMTMLRIVLSLLAAAAVAALPALAKAQSLADSGDSSSAVVTTTPALPDLTYTRPTGKTKLHNYVFDVFGPYPIVGAGLAAGINQAYDTPPKWKQGAAGYGRRFGSDFGIAAVSTTTRYALAQAFKEDTLYYRCECRGLFRRLGHAGDIDFDRTTRRSRPPCLFSPSAHRSVCWFDDRCLRVVSRSLRR